MTSVAILKKIGIMEQELQQLKLETYFGIPNGRRPKISRASDAAIARAVKNVRENVWQERYAKKVARLS